MVGGRREGSGRRHRLVPRERVAGWPDGMPGSPVAVETDDPAVAVAAGLAVNLRAHLVARGLTHRAVADLCQIGHTTVGDIVRGAAWPDLRTVALLEAGLGVDLWPVGAAGEVGIPNFGVSTGAAE